MEMSPTFGVGDFYTDVKDEIERGQSIWNRGVNVSKAQEIDLSFFFGNRNWSVSYDSEDCPIQVDPLGLEEGRVTFSCVLDGASFPFLSNSGFLKFQSVVWNCL